MARSLFLLSLDVSHVGKPCFIFGVQILRKLQVYASINATMIKKEYIHLRINHDNIDQLQSLIGMMQVYILFSLYIASVSNYCRFGLEFSGTTNKRYDYDCFSSIK